jgi:redox-sensitive bicupin YhaK (pirin superfamily)
MSKNVELVIRPREKDLGGFQVRRILPYAAHRMVGPFIFFDHMGPAEFAPGNGMDVRPHPHIGLATVTYLFEGAILHRDSLGSVQLIKPGAINLMTAGRGIVHSERTPENIRATGARMNGIQCWLALPEEFEEIEPSFSHHPSDTLPVFKVDDATLKLLLGESFGRVSPARVHSDLFYLELRLPAGGKITLPREKREQAIYLVEGEASLDGKKLQPFTMAVTKADIELSLEAIQDSHFMMLGGALVGERFIWWNLVASTQEKINHAKAEWAIGPMPDHTRFHPIPGDENEFIPLPIDTTSNPKGTVL